jgi:hypothetical protein
MFVVDEGAYHLLVSAPIKTKTGPGKSKQSKTKVLRGRLSFHAETGTEGGYWAFQDERFVHHVPPEYGVYNRERVWDAAQPQRQGRAQEAVEVLMGDDWLPFPDPIQNDPLYYESSLFKGQPQGSREADAQLAEKYGFELEYGNMGTPKTTPWRPYGISRGQPTRADILWEDGEREQRRSETLLVERWEYEGLHLLKTGDVLTIFEQDTPQKVRWQGEIELVQLPLFTEDALGYWIHADMKGWVREEWAQLFFDGYPAELVIAS